MQYDYNNYKNSQQAEVYRQGFQIDLRQLAQTLDVDTEQLYESIRKDIIRHIKVDQLAITMILPDLIDVLKENPKHFYILCDFICNNYLSYGKIANKYQMSKQGVYQMLQIKSKKYIWLRNLMEIKGMEERKE